MCLSQALGMWSWGNEWLKVVTQSHCCCLLGRLFMSKTWNTLMGLQTTPCFSPQDQWSRCTHGIICQLPTKDQAHGCLLLHTHGRSRKWTLISCFPHRWSQLAFVTKYLRCFRFLYAFIQLAVFILLLFLYYFVVLSSSNVELMLLLQPV